MPDERERRTRGARDLLSGLRSREGPKVRRPERLDTPVDLRRPLLGRGYDPERLGRVSERVARFLGTGRFIIYMTVFVGVWLVWNSVLPRSYQFDTHLTNFTLLTLILSLQASYAAPLILLAQNRQDDRDRVNLDSDRRNDAQVRADLDFLSREVASLRLAVGEVATRDYVRSELRQLTDTLTELLGVDEEAQAAQADAARRKARKAEKAERDRAAAAAAKRAARAAAIEPGEHPPTPPTSPAPANHAAPAHVRRGGVRDPHAETKGGGAGGGAGSGAAREGAPERSAVGSTGPAADRTQPEEDDDAVVGGRR